MAPERWGGRSPAVDPRPVTTLVRDGLELRYEVRGGSGPALLLPHLQFSWPDLLDLSLFVERFSVIIASPRGFADSSRLDPVDGGGEIRSSRLAYLDSRFDYRAALAFYRELSQLPADSLVTDLRCPLLAFWGDQDEKIAFGGGTEQLASGLDRRGLQHVSFPGHDHDGMLPTSTMPSPACFLARPALAALTWASGLSPEGVRPSVRIVSAGTKRVPSASQTL